MKEERVHRRLDTITRDVIEDVVIDWMNKYPIEGGNLAVGDFDNPEKIQLWAQGVWGRIAHQLSESGLPYDNAEILLTAGKVFFDQISGHPMYDKIKPHLPPAVVMHDSSQAK